MIVIRINRNINDYSRDFAYLFRIINEFKDLESSQISFDFSGCEFLQQNAVALLGGFVRYLQYRDNKVYFKFNTIIDPVRVNLEQNSFLSELGLGGGSWDGNSIPYREDLVLDGNSYSDYLSERWLGRGWLDISDALKSHITIPVLEIYDNVFSHAQSPIGVISCGQRYPKKKELKLAVVDFGLGIPTTVRNFLGQVEMSAKDALEWAFEPRKTTKNYDTLDYTNFARGNGLKILKTFIENNNGKLEIYSDKAYARIGKELLS